MSGFACRDAGNQKGVSLVERGWSKAVPERSSVSYSEKHPSEVPVAGFRVKNVLLKPVLKNHQSLPLNPITGVDQHIRTVRSVYAPLFPSLFGQVRGEFNRL